MAQIPVIDIFAGPGGLSEGFASVRGPNGHSLFDVRLSIEKDPIAHRTLALRALFRAFEGRVPDVYYDYMRGAVGANELWAAASVRSRAHIAHEEALCVTLGEENYSRVSRLVKQALNKSETWVLIGGPPCQAYSIVGRSRMRSSAPRKFEKDERHYLYKEYLRILGDHAPPVFLMENVKGLLSATIGGQRIFEQIIQDLERPNGGSLRYRIVPLSSNGKSRYVPEDFVIRSEKFGIPQTRHRVILCGIREELCGHPHALQAASANVPIESAIGDLPLIRSRLSRVEDSHERWLEVLHMAASRMRSRGGKHLSAVAAAMDKSARLARSVEASGSQFFELSPKKHVDWPVAATLSDQRLGGVTAHESRAHIPLDLHRYLFAACYASLYKASPKLRDFPSFLLPKHDNVGKGRGAPFQDRFRVQVFGHPATTVVSHIAKDGHYFIHPNAIGCRSLTVREAARLQTFPDNYHFEGNRTQQYVQVGNAVPPLLAQQIAKTIGQFISRNDASDEVGRPREVPDLEIA